MIWCNHIYRALWVLCVALHLPTAAMAQSDSADDTWYIGLPIALATVAAAEGTLDEKDRISMLKAQTGTLLTPRLLRADIATIYRMGQYSAVEVDVQPWGLIDENGDVRAAAAVTYHTYQAPKLTKIEIQGNSRISKREIMASTLLREGDVYYPELDNPRVRKAVLEYYRDEGFPNAALEVDPVALDSYHSELWIRINEGEPDILTNIHFSGAPTEISERKLRRWAKKGGLREGKPMQSSAIDKARLEIRRRMAHTKMGPITQFLSNFFKGKHPRRLGWVNARVSPSLEQHPNQQFDVTFEVQADAQLFIQSLRLGRRADHLSLADLLKALSINERLRLTRGFVEQAPDQVEDWLRFRGFHNAKTEAVMERSTTSQTLVVRSSKGLRFGLGAMNFEGLDDLKDREPAPNALPSVSASDLRHVMRQASPQVLRRKRYSEKEVDKARQQAEILFASRGFHNASIKKKAERERKTIGVLWWPRRRVDLDFVVAQGLQTHLDQCIVEGTVDGIAPELHALLSGNSPTSPPLSPQYLKLLMTRLITAHHEAGYMEAQARLFIDDVAPQRQTARIILVPGEKLTMRSLGIKGNRRVKSGFIRGLLKLEPGILITPTLLTEIREKLYEVDMFSSVNLTLLGEDSARDLIAEVKEQTRNSVETGFGFSTDEGIRILGRYTRRNIIPAFGGADQIQVQGLLGFDFYNTSNKISFNSPEFRIGAVYSTPIKETVFSVEGLFQERIQERTWRLIRSGAGFSLNIPMRNKQLIEFTIQAKLETVRLEDADPGSLLKNEPWGQLVKSLDPSLDTSSRLTDSVSVVVVRDGLDNPLQPTRGTSLQALLELSPGIPLTEKLASLRVPHAKFEAKVNAYIPIRKGVTLRLNSSIGHVRVLPLGKVSTYTIDGPNGPEELRAGVPLEERYRLGGTSSMRGYRQAAVGPQNEVQQLDLDWPGSLRPSVDYGLRSTDTRWVPTGGDTLFLGVAELQIPLTALGLEDWDGYYVIAFADVGNTWLLNPDSSATSMSTEFRENFKFNPILRYGAGLGFRMDTAVGPIQLDLGFNPERLFGGETRKILLRDKWKEPGLRAHVSFGTLF